MYGMVNQRCPADSPESSTVMMCGCCRRAASLISRRNRSGPSDAASSGWSTLSATGPVVLQVLGQVDGRHAAAAELALERVPLGQRGLELRADLGLHGVPATSRLEAGIVPQRIERGIDPEPRAA